MKTTRVISVLALLAAGTAVGLVLGEGAPPKPRASYGASLDALNREIQSHRRRAEGMPGTWTARETLGSLHLERAKLTGSFDDYEEAESALAEAFRIAPEGSGPFLARAKLHYTLHRFDEAEKDILGYEKRIIIDDPTRAEITAMRGDLALQRGDRETARRLYTEAMDLDATLATAFRMSRYHAEAGEFARAEVWIDRAADLLPRPDPHLTAWLHLQRGILDLERDRWDAAMLDYEAGNRLFPGWWLIEEHMAEILALQGKTAEAERWYRDLVERTGNPMLMNALSKVLREQGKEAEAETWHDRAHSVQEDRARRFPEAASDHALMHSH